MLETTERAIQEMLDRDAIREVLARYARGIDRYDVELVRDAYHADGIDCHGVVTVGINEFVDDLMPGLRDRQGGQHLLASSVIELDGDVAHVETPFVVVAKRKDEDWVEQMGGRYVDRFERRDGQWRIAMRVVTGEWATRTPSLDEKVRQFHSGSLDRGDVSYERPLQERAPIG